MVKFQSQVHNFGEVKYLSNLTHSFCLTSDSEELLQSEITPSCGCTSANYNSTTRCITAIMKADSVGQKNTTITIDKNGVKTYLVLQAFIKQ